MFSRVVLGMFVAAIPAFCDWNPQLAANYLDGRQKEWFAWPRANTAVGVCVSCHTGLPYMLARPALRTVLKEAGPSPYETGFLDAVKKRIPTFGTTPAEPVLTALLLARQDAGSGHLSQETERAFDSLWSLQIASGPSQGAWNWNNTGRDPFSAPYGQFFGATMAALAIGVAPDGYQSRPQIQKNLDALKRYLADQRSEQPLHNRLALVWASTALKGALGDADRQAIVTELLGKQQRDGGWTLESLGPWSQHPNAPHSEGSHPYATGLAAFVLETTGLSAANPNLEHALSWLRSHQDAKSGFWDAQSNTVYEPGSMPFQFMRDVATGFAVLALTGTKPEAVSNQARAWTAPRKPDGRPDLEGAWSNASNTPLERPKELGTKEFYTPDEFAALVAEKGFLGDRGGPQEVHYDFAQFGMDALQSRFAPNLRTSVIAGPEGRIPPMLPEAVKRNAARAANAKAHEFDGPEYRSLTERCIVYGELEGPPMLPPMYNNNMQIVQNSGYVAILNEMYHDTRIIPTDGRPHLAPNFRQWRGDSIGRYEGDTLVVDTSNFTGQTHFHGSSEKLHVVERFTRTGKDTILYQFTVEDPATWAKPWSGELVMGPAIGPIYEFACHEGNYGLPDILSGARVEEKTEADEATTSQPR